MTSPDDPLEALAQLVVRLRAAAAAERAAVVDRLLPLLGNARIPIGLRLAATARAVDALPDTARTVRPIVRAITAGLSPVRAIERLRHLQHLTERGHALDALVAVRERKVKMGCPRCGVRLARADMAKHLWHQHGLALVDGKTRGRPGAIKALHREYAATGDPALIDRAVDVGGEAAVRKWAAETASDEEALPLCAAARDRGVSLCPVCFADVPLVVPALPPVLAVAHSRLAGDGLVATAPGAFPPRVAATVVAAAVLFTVTVFAHVALGFVFAILAYFVTLVARIVRGPMDTGAVDAAWRKLAPRSADQRDAARFLTRLCRTSVGRGDAMERANVLQRVIARAQDNPAEQQLLAAALALQMDDAGRLGRDRAAGIADLVAPVFRGEQPAAFAEYVLATYLSGPHDAGERVRLRVLLYRAAFDAGLAPRAVIDLCAAAEHVAEAMQFPPPHVAQLFGVWTDGRKARPWAQVGDAQTVFDLAAGAPATAARLLVNAPGLLLVCGTPPEIERELGPVLVTTTGVSLGGAVTLDPDADVSVTEDDRALIFGKHRFRLDRGVPEGFLAELKAWLQFRAEVLARYPEQYLSAGGRSPARLIAPFVARCSACGAACVPVVGAVARPHGRSG
ncbi:hypothetical protein [Frigoriglobus tundricola]|uniref:Uncharacterized protein n=1 Tax=Frigoriglobus tundricola TaxID=2774151 RepID=A0A6M5YKP5_9BACT|nr:hypothetical protein [Frigoriglobus tundricola]QJW93572.1 hypothetical protein FTUN_1079 [Frigoriglobus tundricola]